MWKTTVAEALKEMIAQLTQLDVSDDVIRKATINTIIQVCSGTFMDEADSRNTIKEITEEVLG